MDFSPKTLRKTVLEMANHGQSVHIACAFSLIEIFSVLYSKIIKQDFKNPRDPERDYLVLSKGHGVLAQYACFKELGWIGDSEIKNYFKDGSRLHGLSEAHIAGCEVTSGSLGHGFPIAVGIAKGLLLQNKIKPRVYAILGDGELNEGSIWEALMFAAHHKLGNLSVIVDANEFQAMGKTSEILNSEPLVQKFRAFGFETLECDGHDLNRLSEILESFSTRSPNDVPQALIARTVKGKGITFMERANLWHYTRLDQTTFPQAINELEDIKK